ncbi:DEAD/DEAH box helicase [Clostridium niameyense]|uniref:DEAD/DEAH box helicase n=1 Tax=Clostridium niameyense TaxID=1622073 RepID=A0A6M0R6K0_9CLOT|nr:DEAD/DEAH box helicase [Clostridium niameyense]NEZ45795.1 DEAD/DEAH box helicase [Clostridium niameyense]
MENIKFKDLKLSEEVLKAIEYMKFEKPSEVQEQSIPLVLEGYDIIAQAQTGTGKTVAFGAPIISELSHDKDRGIKSLILTPTRELALQITSELKRLSKYTDLKILTVYGGSSIDKQIKDLKRGVDIVVGTPGRVLDHIRRKTVNFTKIKYLVIDEADEMLNMGFIEDINTILEQTNEEKQTMLFSATMPEAIKKLALKNMKKDTKYVSIIKKSLTVDKIQQYYVQVKNRDKLETLFRILDVEEPKSSIIFCRTKKGVDELVEAMQLNGYNVEGMHGDMRQNQRINTLKKFKNASLNFLVATDVAARGIDVQDITHVINYDITQDVESYVHRIGRTGRANKKGIAYSLINSRERSMIRDIERVTKSKIRVKDVPTVGDILEKKSDNLLSNLEEILKGNEYKEFIPIVNNLGDRFDLIDISSALMSMILSKEISSQYTKNSIKSDNTLRLFLNLGRKDNINPKVLLNFIKENSSTDVSEIGDIDILEKFSFMDVSPEAAENMIKDISGKRFNKRRINIEVAKNRK